MDQGHMIGWYDGSIFEPMIRLNVNSKLQKSEFKNFDSLVVNFVLNPGVFH